MLRLHEYRFHRPHSLDNALALLETHAGDAVPIAGGTDLMPNMKHRLFTPGHVIGIRRLPELHGIDVRADELVIGAAETLAVISRNALVRKHAPSLAMAAGLVAGPQLRNMGTLGGNLCLDTRCTYYNQTWFWRSALGYCLKKDGDICHVTKTGRKCVAAHSADTPPVLITLGASLDLVSPRGARSIAVCDFFLADGIWNSVREPDEIVTRIRVPLPRPGTRTAFVKLRQRNSIDFPLLNVAIAMEQGSAGRIEAIRMCVSALGARPREITGLDEIAIGHSPSPALHDAIAERAHAQCHPLTNLIVDADWRRAMVPVHVKRALDRLEPRA
ncbi:MAG: FAD binding domain-containing protein [Gemmatimonadetes bacterium]|nr:FAD binding domain-containing protein [Gemmatimonadota bacterium]